MTFQVLRTDLSIDAFIGPNRPHWANGQSEVSSAVTSNHKCKKIQYQFGVSVVVSYRNWKSWIQLKGHPKNSPPPE